MARTIETKLPSFDEQNPERDVKMEDGIFFYQNTVYQQKLSGNMLLMV